MSRLLKIALGCMMALALLLAWLAAMQQAQAQARRLTWDASVTYQNIGTSATPVQVLFYPEGETEPLRFDPMNGSTLPARAGRSLFLGHFAGLNAGRKATLSLWPKNRWRSTRSVSAARRFH